MKVFKKVVRPYSVIYESCCSDLCQDFVVSIVAICMIDFFQNIREKLKKGGYGQECFFGSNDYIHKETVTATDILKLHRDENVYLTIAFGMLIIRCKFAGKDDGPEEAP